MSRLRSAWYYSILFLCFFSNKNLLSDSINKEFENAQESYVYLEEQELIDLAASQEPYVLLGAQESGLLMSFRYYDGASENLNSCCKRILRGFRTIASSDLATTFEEISEIICSDKNPLDEARTDAAEQTIEKVFEQLRGGIQVLSLVSNSQDGEIPSLRHQLWVLQGAVDITRATPAEVQFPFSIAASNKPTNNSYTFVQTHALVGNNHITQDLGVGGNAVIGSKRLSDPEDGRINSDGTGHLVVLKKLLVNEINPFKPSSADTFESYVADDDGFTCFSGNIGVEWGKVLRVACMSPVSVLDCTQNDANDFILVDGDFDIDGNLEVDEDAIIFGRLDVVGPACFSGGVAIFPGEKLLVTDISSSSFTDCVEEIVTDTICLNGHLSVTGRLGVNEICPVDPNNCRLLDLTGTITMSGNVHLAGGLTVTGDSSITGTLTIFNGDINLIGCDVNACGSLNAGTDLTAGRDLTVTRNGVVGGDFTVLSDVTVGGKVGVLVGLTVIGTTTLLGPINTIKGIVLINEINPFRPGTCVQDNTRTTTFSGSVRISGDLTVDGVFSNPSDRRIKKNIESLDPQECLSRVNSLNPVSFDFISDYRHAGSTKRGFIAQEVEKIIPSAVSTGFRRVGGQALHDFHYLDKIELIVDLVGALQASYNEVELLKDMNAEIVRRLEELELQMQEDIKDRSCTL